MGFGPVVPAVYHEFKQYGSGNIPSITSYIVFDPKDVWNSYREKYNPNIISEQDKKIINKVVDTFSEYSATDLVDLTHRQAPWREAYRKYQNNEITQDSIKRYFL